MTLIKYPFLVLQNPYLVLSTMHLIGKSIETYGINLNNDTTPFVKVPNWDFEWQGSYHFNKMPKLNPGSMVKATAFYDNTSSNLHNPNTPPQTICAGFNTTDEMFVIYYLYTDYMSGDENLSVDSVSQSGLTIVYLILLRKSSSGFLTHKNSFTIKSKWPSNEINKIEFYDILGHLIFAEKINDLTNIQFQKIYEIEKVFHSLSSVALIRLYHNSGQVQYCKVIVR